MARENILITVKTYPTLSKTYSELVCTAGFREDGSWVRIYPLPFRRLDHEKRYKKFQWVEVDLVKSSSDHRPETQKVADINGFKIGAEIPAKSIDVRKSIVLKNPLYTNKKEIIKKAKANELSLVVFKPSRITGFVIKEEEERDWDPEKLKALEADRKQLDIFKGYDDQFKVVKKLPYKFSYTFEDDQGEPSTLMILDWEIGALYWNCLRDSGGDETVACQKVRKKYWENFAQSKDVYFFLGTTKEHHQTARNPFVIIGVWAPEIDNQLKLL